MTIQDEFGPYLYANQYVNFSADSKVISKAMELSASANDDLEVIEMSIIILSRILLMIMTKLHLCRAAICLMWMMSLPVRPDLFWLRRCHGFHAPVWADSHPPWSRYMGDVYHAWISTYIKDKGWVNGIIEFDGNDWKLMDPTFASTSSDP